MTKEQLEERINTLESSKEELQAKIHAINGAISDCKYWLEELSKEDSNVEERVGNNGTTSSTKDFEEDRRDK